MGMIFKRKHKVEGPNGEVKTVEGKTYWIQYYQNGERIRESTQSTSKSHATKVLALRSGQVAKGEFPGLNVSRTTFDELAADMLNDYKINNKKSIGRIKSLTDNLKESFGGRRVVTITSNDITAYIQKRQADKATNGTINRELSALRRMFNLGAEQVPPKVVNPVAIKLLEENNVRKGFFEYADYLNLLKVLPEHLQPVLIAGYYTGMRRGELLSLTWPQVDLVEGKITLDPGTTKSNKARTIYLTAELYQTIARQKEVRDKLYPDCSLVFFSNGAKIKYFRKSWLTACKAAGIPGKLFHDLRRSAVRNMVRSGISENVAMRISGHSTRSVFDRYDITSEEDLKSAAGKVAAYHGKMTEKMERKNDTATVLATSGTLEAKKTPTS